MSDTSGVAEAGYYPPETSSGGPCVAWAAVDDLPEGCPCRTEGSGGEDPSDDELEELLMQATEVIWTLLAFPYLGPCPRTIHPCRTNLGYAPSKRVREATLRWGACACCGCDAVTLAGPIADVTEVIVDGVTLASSEYELHDNMHLVRVNGTWPMGGGPASEQNFVITYLIGAPVPTLVRDAVIELANQLWLDRCGSADSRLPRAATGASSQGVSYSFSRREEVDRVKTAGSELPTVRKAVSTYNPTGASLRTLVYSPDQDFKPRTIRTF